MILFADLAGAAYLGQFVGATWERLHLPCDPMDTVVYIQWYIRSRQPRYESPRQRAICIRRKDQAPESSWMTTGYGS